MTPLRWMVLPLACGALLACHYDLSFKSVEFRDVEYERVFELSRKVIALHYSGTFIRDELESGRIETGLVEYETRDHSPRRERVLCVVRDLGDGRVEVELLAEIKEMEIDLDHDETVLWRTKGSDVRAEELLLDEIVGEVQLAYPDRLVMAAD